MLIAFYVDMSRFHQPVILVPAAIEKQNDTECQRKENTLLKSLYKSFYLRVLKNI